LACLSGGRFRLLLLVVSALFISSCGIFVHGDRLNSLNPTLVFGEGASFLEGASTLAIKGRIEFREGRATTQSGSFQLFLNGPDSASFLIEGPFGADAFKMVVLGDKAHILTDDGWTTLRADDRIDFAEYGISNISPFLIGPIIFPQYYPARVNSIDGHGNLLVEIDNIDFYSFPSFTNGHFSLWDPQTDIVSSYERRKNAGDGFYPSHIEVHTSGFSEWYIILNITRIKENSEIPPAVWAAE